ncbi:MAG: transcriptional regulator with PAS, ATPase and Fis domain [Cognaticolwellia sp.]|jgi:transcriptional regulator with PAS, ATPase and Fis domain
MDDTRTATLSLHQSAQGPALGLEVVWHPDPSFVGGQRSVSAGERLVLGRNSLELGGALQEPRISRRQSELGRLGSALSVRDLDSHNGSWVNGVRVKSAVLQPGDVLGVGQVLLLVRELPLNPAPLSWGRLVGRSPALQAALETVDRVAGLDMPVLVQGESGTGKELVAQELHARSGREGPFVAVNCAGVADSLLQSELFGHVRGAYSGAEKARRGLVDQARGGTLLLDEIGDASPALQAALLRLLQERELRPVGSDTAQVVNVRFVAATNRDLVAEVRRGRFREDLYARLSRQVVFLPPLRARRSDILSLVHSLLGGARLSHGLAQTLVLHDWPGNARAVQAVVEQLLLRAEGEVLEQPEWLADVMARQARAEDGVGSPVVASSVEVSEQVSEQKRALSAMSHAELRQVLITHLGNLAAAAKDLGVGRNTLYRHLQRAGVDLEALREELGDGRGR